MITAQQTVVAADYYPPRHPKPAIVAGTVQARNALYRAGQDAFRDGAAPQEMVTAEMRDGFMRALYAAADSETVAYLVQRGNA